MDSIHTDSMDRQTARAIVEPQRGPDQRPIVCEDFRVGDYPVSPTMGALQEEPFLLSWLSEE